MEAIVAKMKEYLSMEEEIEFKEFDRYYHQVLDFLNKDYQELSEEDLVAMRYILNVMAANAGSRGLRRDAYTKKFRKMEEKAKFWSDAIAYKLKKEMGYTNDSLDEAEAAYDKKITGREEAAAEAPAAAEEPATPAE